MAQRCGRGGLPSLRRMGDMVTNIHKTWSCKIGEVHPGKLPHGSDLPMREAVRRAYLELTGEEPVFIFSGWGAELTEPERAVVEDRPPSDEYREEWMARHAKGTDA